MGTPNKTTSTKPKWEVALPNPTTSRQGTQPPKRHRGTYSATSRKTTLKPDHPNRPAERATSAHEVWITIGPAPQQSPGRDQPKPPNPHQIQAGPDHPTAYPPDTRGSVSSNPNKKRPPCRVRRTSARSLVRQPGPRPNDPNKTTQHPQQNPGRGSQGVVTRPSALAEGLGYPRERVHFPPFPAKATPPQWPVPGAQIGTRPQDLQPG